MASPADYPLTVVYCGNCGLPPDLCEYSGKFEACKPWLKANAPHLYPQLFASESAPGDGGSASGSSTSVEAAAAGIATMIVGDGGGDSDSDSDAGPKKKPQAGKKPSGGGGKGGKGAKEGAVIITKKDRGKRKYVTSISGLEAYGLKLKEVASALGKKFGAGASVVKNAEGKQEIDVQGDLSYDLPDVLSAQFGVPEDAIVVKE